LSGSPKVERVGCDNFVTVVLKFWGVLLPVVFENISDSLAENIPV
jgi:hypothetical protein